jgi:hypothetical protein
MERRSERNDSLRSEAIVDARMSLALWLRAGRAHRRMSLEAVAKVTKIQPRILERLEAGKLEGLPAEVFVRGFVRSFARCVGLDEGEALRRYAACGLGVANPSDLTPTVRALVEAMVDLAPGSAMVPRATPRRMQAVEVIDLAAGSPRDLSSEEAVVETMMLPETGTVVMPAHPMASLAEAMTDSDTIAVVSVVSAIPVTQVTTSISVGAPTEVMSPVTESASVLRSVVTAGPATASQPAVLIRVDGGLAESTESIPAGQPIQLTQKKRGRRGKGRNKRPSGNVSLGLSRELYAVGMPASASPIVTGPVALAAGVPAAGVPAAGVPAAGVPAAGVPAAGMPAAGMPAAGMPAAGMPAAGVPAVAGMSDAGGSCDGARSTDEPIMTWAPKMPAIAAAPSVPWRRPAYAAAPAASGVTVVPSLVIDDADPDSAERILEGRAERHAPRRSFLPPILLDREDRSVRQGGLTLAVILLLIAATLTLSYLMRRPSAGGDGMTRLDTPAGDLVSLARG